MRTHFLRLIQRNIRTQFPDCPEGPLHPAVALALEKTDPKDYYKLALANPTGVYTVKFFQRPEHIPDRVTEVSPGKFLNAHFPLPSHEIRSIVAKASLEGTVEIWNTTEKMIQAVQECVFETCMHWNNDYEYDHPYHAYAPEYGWAVAVRILNSKVVARALIQISDKVYVRCFGANVSVGKRQTDEQLQGWLEAEGYTRGSWAGYKLAKIEQNNACGFLAPYLDGDTQDVEVRHNHLLICENGDYSCTNTDGTAEEKNSYECACCNERYSSEEDLSSVGESGEEQVCERCLIGGYIYVIGRGFEYYVPDDDAICTLEGGYYDEKYLDSNYIVEITAGRYAGRYAELDNVIVTVGEKVYFVDDNLVQLEHGMHNGEYAPKEDTWTCEHSGEVYHDEDSYTCVDGGRVYNDYIEEYREELRAEEAQQKPEFEHETVEIVAEAGT